MYLPFEMSPINAESISETAFCEERHLCHSAWAQSSCSLELLSIKNFPRILSSGAGKERGTLFLYKCSYLSGHDLNLPKMESCSNKELCTTNYLFMLV